jgi:hypothetical protein
LAAALVVLAVDAANFKYYGVFRNNDFRSSDFQAGYGALSRIRHDDWRRYVVFPRDARERAYAMSPAAAELRPFFEGPHGEVWRDIACGQAPSKDCPEIFSAWFVWALRDAVNDAGHYRNAREARGFYSRLAAEIEAGCRQRPDDCLPARKTLAPPWHSSYLALTLAASRDIFYRLATLDGGRVSVGHSIASPEKLAFFAAMTNSAPAPTEEGRQQASGSSAKTGPNRVAFARWLARRDATISTFGLPVALGLWFIWAAWALVRRRIDVPLVVATALAGAVASRVFLLGFLDATSIPSNSLLYLSPVVPMALLLLPTVAWGIWRKVRPGISP